MSVAKRVMWVLAFMLLTSLQSVYSKGLVASLKMRILTRTLGLVPADDWCQKTAHEFLNYFGVTGVNDVVVYAYNNPKDAIRIWTTGDVILLNEVYFNLFDKKEKLWFFAHEAAHMKLGHAQKFAKDCKKASFFSALAAVVPVALFVAGQGQDSYFLKMSYLAKTLLVSGVGLIYAMGSHQLFQTDMLTAFRLQKAREIEADLVAAKMLCEHGMQDVVEYHVQELKNLNADGSTVFNYFDHPSFYESVAYLEKFLTDYAQVKEQQSSVKIAANL